VSRSSASRTSTAKSSSNVLRPLSEPLLAPPVSRIEGRPLRPEAFRPEAGRPSEADGKPLSKFGWRFREVFAQAHKVDESEVDLGLVRQVEALNADTEHNLAALAAVQAKRTEHGTPRYVRVIANTPLLEPWLLNGRALRRMATELRGASRVVTTATDHPLLALPTMHVDGPETVLEIVAAQRRLLGLESYTSTGSKKEKRDRVDSIVQFGVLEPPDVVLVQLCSDTGSAWVPQAAEGAQRLFSALVGMDQLANRNVGMLAAEHWLSGKPTLRDLTAADLERISGELSFPASAAAGYFPGRDVKLWLETTADENPAAVAFQLLRTMEINLIIAVEPDHQVTVGERNPVSSTIQEMIRSYHVPGKAKDQWDLPDVQGLIAIGAIDELLEANRISDANRSAWLGETMPDWQGAGDATPNRLVSVAQLVAALTTQKAALPASGGGEDSLEVVNRHLRLNGQRVHADDRAKVAAAQAIVALGRNNTGKENTLSAAIFGAFHAPWFWKADEHTGGPWPALLATPIQELTQKALAEAKSSADTDTCGPAQRALAALGGLALMSNPGLLEDDKALTRTARGGGGKATTVKASDPNVLLAAMAQEERGINQLHDAIIALTANAEPTIPIDREDSHELDEFYLREMWLGEKSDKEDNPLSEFARLVKELASSMIEGSNQADYLREALPGDVIGLEQGDDDDPDLWGEALYEAIGVNEQTATDALPALQNLVEFFTTGKALARAAARAAR
jgi:hypothetical protein